MPCKVCTPRTYPFRQKGGGRQSFLSPFPTLQTFAYVFLEPFKHSYSHFAKLLRPKCTRLNSKQRLELHDLHVCPGLPQLRHELSHVVQLSLSVQGLLALPLAQEVVHLYFLRILGEKKFLPYFNDLVTLQALESDSWWSRKSSPSKYPFSHDG